MKKVNFKKVIQDRYKGRGNSWVKVNKENIVYTQLISFISTIEDDTSSFVRNIEREGFAWLRFSKASGSEDKPLCVFEVRYQGSKIDHPNCLLEINDSDAESLELLGNTPHKLQLEIKPSERSLKPNKTNTQVKKKVEDEDIIEKVRIIKEATLTKPSNRELENWYNFLRVNNMYEEHV